MRRASIVTILLFMARSGHAAGIGVVVDDRARAEISIKIRIAPRVWVGPSDNGGERSAAASSSLCLHSTASLDNYTLALVPASKAISGDANAWRRVKALATNASHCLAPAGDMPPQSGTLDRTEGEAMILLVSPQ